MTETPPTLPTLDDYWAADPALRHKITMLWFLEWESGNEEAARLYRDMLIGKGKSETVYRTPYGEDRDLW